MFVSCKSDFIIRTLIQYVESQIKTISMIYTYILTHWNRDDMAATLDDIFKMLNLNENFDIIFTEICSQRLN